MTYATDLFDESTVVSFAERLVRVLEAMVAEPDSVVGDVELLGEDERSQVLVAVNDTVHELTVGALLLDGFVAQVAASRMRWRWCSRGSLCRMRSSGLG